METQTKLIIGGVVVAALVGYWWYEKKKSALPAGATVPTGATAPPTPAAPNPNVPPLPAAGAPPGFIGPPAPAPAAPVYTRVTQMAPMAPTNLGAQGMATTFATPSANVPAASASDVQQWLNDIGANPAVPMTGIWDAATKSALASFQSAVSLPPTGFADATTVAFLQGKALDTKLPGN